MFRSLPCDTSTCSNQSYAAAAVKMSYTRRLSTIGMVLRLRASFELAFLRQVLISRIEVR